MTITATELKENLDHYLSLAATKSIMIQDNGKVIAVLSNPVKSLRGIIPAKGNLDLDAIRMESLAKHL